MAFLQKSVQTAATSAVVVCIILGLAVADYGHHHGNHPAVSNVAGGATIEHQTPAPVNVTAVTTTGTIKTVTTRSSTTPSKLPGWQCDAPIQTMSGGLNYRDCKMGTGATPKAGDIVSVNYTGYLMDGTKFDSSVDPSRGPFLFVLGTGEVIKGWDEGVATMKVGGKRKLIIPPALAYGDEGTPGGPIAPHATIVFDVKLLSARG